MEIEWGERYLAMLEKVAFHFKPCINVMISFSSWIQRYEKRLLGRLRQKVRAHKIAQAIEANEALTCDMCCNDHLKDEVISCTQGHQACALCIEGQTKELVIGQIVVSIESDTECSWQI